MESIALDEAAFEEAALEDEVPALLRGVTVLLCALVAREGVGLELVAWPELVIGGLLERPCLSRLGSLSLCQRLRRCFQLYGTLQ